MFVLIERIPEHCDHNFLRSRVRDICSNYVSVPPKSDLEDYSRALRL
jgi:hypothetical protein